VTGTTSSIEALSLIKSSPNSFDLVITDMSMPTMLGTELAKKLLAIRPDLPIILCSGFSERITPKTAMDMGIKAFLEKPVLAQDLFSKIRNILDLEKDG
jgi:YesN/AraC family two-component response regulator